MLVGSCVENDRGMVGFKNFVQTLLIADGTNQRDNGGLGTVFVAQLGLKLIGAVFVDVKNQQTTGLVAHDLAAKLTADGTAAARDQHDLVMQIFGDLGVVQLLKQPM